MKLRSVAMAVCLFTLATIAMPVRGDSPWLYGIHWWGYSGGGVDDVPATLLDCPTYGGWDMETVMTHSDWWWGAGYFAPLYQNLYGTKNMSMITRIDYQWGQTVPAPTTMSAANWASAVVSGTVNTLAPYCHIWQIGNEPNLYLEGNGWTGNQISPANYATIYRAVRSAIHSTANASPAGDHIVLIAPVSPGAVIPDVRWMDGADWMGAVLDNIPEEEIDGVAIHSYGGSVTDFHNSYVELLGELSSRGLDDVPVYMTEWARAATPGNATTEAEAANFCRQAFADVNTWNSTAGNHNIVCMTWFVYDANEQAGGGWNGTSIEYWRSDGYPLGDYYDLYTAFAQTVDLRYPAGAGGNPEPPEDGMTDAVPSGTNLSLTATQYSTDSNYSSSYAGDKAKDGVISGSSKWCSNGNAPPHWLKFDLGQTCTVNGFIVRHAGAAGEPSSYNTEAFKIQSATSYTGPWTDETSVNNSGHQNVTNRKYVTPKALRYVRLYITDAGIDNYARIPEFEVRGQAPTVPTITLSPTSLSVQTNQGSSPSAGTFTVDNTGQGTLSYSITDNATWLSCSPTSGTSTGEADTITVTYSTASLAAGTYNATITVSDPNASNNPRTVAVTLTVNAVGGMTDAVPTGTNLSLTATQVAVDTQYGAEWGGNKAIDGVLDGNSKWCSTGASATHWLKLDLGANYTVNGYIVRHAGAAGEPSSYNTQTFKIQYASSYSGPWTDDTSVNNSAQANVTNRSFVTPQTRRYIRLYITDPGIDNYARIPEFEVRGSGGGGTVSEDFNSMPSWSSSFDASWGSAAAWSVVSGGQAGTCLQAGRSSQGSSAKAKVYNINANTNYTISIYVRCPSFGGSYWAECAYRLGAYTAQNFDESGGSWTMIKKFSNDGTNGNGDAWVQYSATFNSGSNTQISVGYKLGSSGGGGPTVKWDTLRVN